MSLSPESVRRLQVLLGVPQVSDEIIAILDASGPGGIGSLTGNGFLGTVVQSADNPAFQGVRDYVEYTLPDGLTVGPAEGQWLIIRAQTRITIAGIINASGKNPFVNDALLNGFGASVGSGGGGGGGGGDDSTPVDGTNGGDGSDGLQWGLHGQAGSLPGAGGTAGLHGSPATAGGDGEQGTGVVGLYPPFVAAMGLWPGGPLSNCLGGYKGADGRAGASGGRGGNNPAGAAAGGAAGLGGNGGGLVILIAPEIVLAETAIIRCDGADGTDATAGTAGTAGAAADQGGNGGGGGGSGGGGGCGGAIGMFGNAITIDDAAVLTADGGTEGTGAAGGAGSAGHGGGAAGQAGGDGADGVTGCPGAVKRVMLTSS